MEGLCAGVVRGAYSTAVVVNRDERPWSESAGDRSALPDRHVQVSSPRKNHRVAECCELLFGEQCNAQVEVPFVEPARSDGPGLGAAMAGVDHNVDGLEPCSGHESNFVRTWCEDRWCYRVLLDDREGNPVEHHDAEWNLTPGRLGGDLVS